MHPQKTIKHLRLARYMQVYGSYGGRCGGASCAAGQALAPAPTAYSLPRERLCGDYAASVLKPIIIALSSISKLFRTKRGLRTSTKNSHNAVVELLI